MTGHPIKAAVAIALILCAFAAPARADEAALAARLDTLLADA